MEGGNALNDGMFQSKQPLSEWGHGSFAGLGLLLGKHWLGEPRRGKVGGARVINERGEEISNEQFRSTTFPHPTAATCSMTCRPIPGLLSNDPNH